MSSTQFRSEDWVYVADQMGRLGQGYYKNRQNPSQTITAEEFERRRSQPVTLTKENTEQNINKNTTTVASTTGSGLLATAGTEQNDLSPWDNPVVGEQKITSESAQTDAVQQTKVTPQVSQSTQAVAQEERKKKQQANQNTSGENTATALSAAPSDGSDGADSKVICTEMTRQGRMNNRHCQLCTQYARKHLPPSFMRGYQFWAVPYVRLMRRSRIATQMMSFFVNHRTAEVLYRLGVRKKGSMFGKLICAVHDPLCSFLGHMIEPVDYQSLYQKEAYS
ncbi:hypothetical protein RYZ26_09460 [Terasakiella sp. A23]|uniref:hypothetical protein n=1 Tax=Terasakiella sp. FCG-A23 TaxID=3080561 RepID=UPI0029552CDE|nr:hypothetical protein [Terasakiella sp. A23]MDV7339819.1 hypothetical protein [Terasakiella sp. A23]